MHNAQGLYSGKINDPTTNFLEHIRTTLKFKKWFYGHWHDDWKWDDFQLLYDKVVKII